jgi:rod shape-determining protein MreD
MSRLLVYFALGFGCILLQTAFFPRLLPMYFKPDLLLILVIYLALNEGGGRAALLAYALGSLLDVFSGAWPGLFGLTLLVTYLAGRIAVRRLNTESSLLLLFMVLCCTFVHSAVLVFLAGFFAEAGSLGAIVLRRLPIQLALNLAAALVLLQAIAFLQRRYPRLRIPALGRLDGRYES